MTWNGDPIGGLNPFSTPQKALPQQRKCLLGCKTGIIGRRIEIAANDNRYFTTLRI
jgi:hypothetical protein